MIPIQHLTRCDTALIYLRKSRQMLLVLFRWLLPLVLEGVLAPRLLADVPVMDATGHWGALVSAHAHICPDSSAIWVWDRPGDAELRTAIGVTAVPPTSSLVAVLDNNAKVLGHWIVPVEVFDIATDDRCNSAWIIDITQQRLFLINRAIDSTPVGQVVVSSAHGAPRIMKVTPALDAEHAWIRYYDKTPVAVVERRAAGLVVRTPSGLQNVIDESDLEPSADGKLAWIAPSNKGLWVSDWTQARLIEQFKDVDVGQVYSGSGGEVVWIAADKGLYLLDNQGRVISDRPNLNLLPKGEIADIVKTGRYPSTPTLSSNFAWILSESHRLYGFRTEKDAQGVLHLHRLNEGKPLARFSSDDPMPITIVSWAGDGSNLWLVSTDNEHSENWKSIWKLSVNTNDRFELKLIDPKLYSGKRPTTLYTGYPDKTTFWVRTADSNLSVYAINTEKNSAELAFNGLMATNIFQSTDVKRLIIDTPTGLYIMGPASELSDGKIQFGDNVLTRTNVLLTDQLSDKNMEVSLPLPVRNYDDNAKVTLTISPGNTDPALPKAINTLAAGSASINADGKASIQVLTRGPLLGGKPYTFDLQYSNGRLFDAHLVWKNVVFQLPWYQQPFFRALVVLAAPILLLCLALSKYVALRRWVPIAVPVIEVALVKLMPDLAPNALAINALHLAAAFVVLFVVTFVVALSSPQVLRVLSTLHPYSALVPTVMQIGAVRKRFFARYIAELRSTLKQKRKAASEESYVVIPNYVASHSETLTLAASLLTADLSQLIFHRDSMQRVNVLIEAPGGRGKSALLNELIALGIERFVADPMSPLPVIIDLRSASLAENISTALGRHRLSDEFIRSHLRQGDLALFIDGLSETTADTAILEYLFSDPEIGNQSRLCATTRPLESWRNAVQKSDRWLIAHPEKLSDDNVRAFIQHYADSSVEQGARSAMIAKSQQILPIARSPDGSYLPLLVRMSMLALEDNINSVADLYRSTVERLLRKSGSLQDVSLWMKAATELAYKTYWELGERIFYCDPFAENIALVDKLLEAGVLVGADVRPTKLDRRPQRVRFIHDSVQSYLVARALFNNGDWNALVRAAGDDLFYRASSDLLEGSSELFQMCQYVFRPESKFKNALVTQLDAWAHSFGSSLSVEEIRKILTEENRALLDQCDLQQTAAGLYLQKAYQLLTEQKNAETMLVKLYETVARVVWPLIKDQPAVNTLSIA